ncbi:MAG: hypothetical protein AB1443_02785 [Pseudomonadota bacterium]|jgi:hypothetical protein
MIATTPYWPYLLSAAFLSLTALLVARDLLRTKLRPLLRRAR